MNAGFHPGDQVELPEEPLHLPCSEQHEDGGQEQHRAGKDEAGSAGAGGARCRRAPVVSMAGGHGSALRVRQGMFFIISGDMGIMFVLR